MKALKITSGYEYLSYDDDRVKRYHIVNTPYTINTRYKVKFLGFTVVNGTIAIAHKALQTAMDKVKALTPRSTHKALEPALEKINQWYVG